MTKDDFLAKAQDTIDKQQTKLEKLKEKVQEPTDESTDSIKEVISSLEPKLEQAKAITKEVANVSDDAWENMKDSVEAGWDEMTSDLETGWDKLTDSIKSMRSKFYYGYLTLSQRILDKTIF